MSLPGGRPTTRAAFRGSDADVQAGLRLGIADADLPALSRLLDQGLTLGPGERERWLERLADVDRHLEPPLRKILAMPRSFDTSDVFPSLQGLLGPDDAGGGTPGERVGSYRLVREIGRGGMGAVWLAERADGSFQRHVAIKLPRMAWDDRMAERMARERAIGALLEHPNIARLYDAGADQHGRPYLAMEFIEGRPIDAWCEAGGVSLRRRLRMIVGVARALSYAHGRLVVHRDIKPSNVLVSADGETHLVDFGIAKVLDDAPGNDLTRDHGRLMTLRYASPEQICGGTITVASDVYSLGALTYELLCGHCPYLPSRNTVGAMEQAILAGEPPPASSRADHPDTAKALRGEIDAILGKALKADASQRYASAEAFADDIERHLDGGIVLARPDSFGYRAAKTMRRHVLAIATVGAVAVAVLAAAGISVAQAGRANAEAERARLVKEFVIEMFNVKGGADGSLGQMPGPAMLERSARLIDRKFANQPALQAELFAVVSDMFYNLANLAQAAKYAKRRVEALKLADADRKEIAQAQLRLDDVLIPLDRKEEAEAAARDALALSSDDPSLLARAHATLANVLLYGNRDTDRSRIELEAAEAVVAAGGATLMDAAAVTYARGNWFAFLGKADEASAKYDETVDLALRVEGSTARLAWMARLEKAKTLILLGRSDPGKRALEAGLAGMREANGVGDVNAALWEAYGATWLYFNDALSHDEVSGALARNLASLQRQTGWSPDSYIARVEMRMGYVATRWGDVETGLRLVLKNAPAQVTPDASPLAHWWLAKNMATALMRTDRAAEAPKLVRDMLAYQQSWQTPADVRSTYDLLVLAHVQAAQYRQAGDALAEFYALSGATDEAHVSAMGRALPGAAPPPVPIRNASMQQVATRDSSAQDSSAQNTAVRSARVRSDQGRNNPTSNDATPTS